MALNPGTGPYKTHKRRDTDTEEKPRGDGGRDGREAATSPGTDAWSPQKLEEAGRTFPWSPWMELSPRSLWPPGAPRPGPPFLPDHPASPDLQVPGAPGGIQGLPGCDPQP